MSNTPFLEIVVVGLTNRRRTERIPISTEDANLVAIRDGLQHFVYHVSDSHRGLWLGCLCILGHAMTRKSRFHAPKTVEKGFQQFCIWLNRPGHDRKTDTILEPQYRGMVAAVLRCFTIRGKINWNIGNSQDSPIQHAIQYANARSKCEPLRTMLEMKDELGINLDPLTMMKDYIDKVRLINQTVENLEDTFAFLLDLIPSQALQAVFHSFSQKWGYLPVNFVTMLKCLVNVAVRSYGEDLNVISCEPRNRNGKSTMTTIVARIEPWNRAFVYSRHVSYYYDITVGVCGIMRTVVEIGQLRARLRQTITHAIQELVLKKHDIPILCNSVVTYVLSLAKDNAYETQITDEFKQLAKNKKRKRTEATE